MGGLAVEANEKLGSPQMEASCKYLVFSNLPWSKTPAKAFHIRPYFYSRVFYLLN